MVCTLALVVASFFIWLNPTNQPAIVIAFIFLLKLPFCFALTYVKDREDTALIAMVIGIWLMYEVIVITCTYSMLTFFLLFGPIAIMAKNSENLLDYEAKSTPKNLVSFGLFLSIIFIMILTFTQGFYV